MLMEHLIPSPKQLEQRDWHINKAHHQIEVNVASTQHMALCPVCHQPSARIHSGYELDFGQTAFFLPLDGRNGEVDWPLLG